MGNFKSKLFEIEYMVYAGIFIYVLVINLFMVLNAYFLRWVFRINHLAKSAEKASLYMQLMARKMGMTDEELQEIEEQMGRKY